MNRDSIDDDRLRFFLERRKLIREWARAGEAEPTAVSAFLRTLEEDLESVAAERGAVVITREIGSETHLGLARPEWEAPDYPMAVVAVGWGKTVRFEGASEACWIGLRVRRSGNFREFYDGMHTAVSALEKHSAFKTRTARDNWIEYGHFPCTRPSYWDDLSGYRSDLLDAIATAWDRYDPVVEKVIRSGGERADSPMSEPTPASPGQRCAPSTTFGTGLLRRQRRILGTCWVLRPSGNWRFRMGMERSGAEPIGATARLGTSRVLGNDRRASQDSSHAACSSSSA